MRTIRRHLNTASVLFTAFVSSQTLAQSGTALDAGAGAAYGVVGAALSRAEEAASRSLVNYSHVRGAFGEAVMDRVALGSRRAGGWQVVSVSPKPQGLDGIYVRRDSQGRPIRLLVGEAKFGSSRLSMTKDGRQMSTAWIRPRLAYEASRHISAGRATSVQAAPRPRGLAMNNDTIRVGMADGRAGVFWRSNRASPWLYDGPEGTLVVAQKASLRDGLYYQAGAEGRVRVRGRVYKIDVIRDTISVKIQDAGSAESGRVAPQEIARVKIDAGSRRSYMSVAKEEIARRVLAKRPYLSQEDAKMIASSATRRMRHLEAVVRQQYRPYYVSAFSDIGRAGLAGGMFAGFLDAGLQLYANGDVDWSQVGQLSLLGAGAAGAGSVAHHLVIAAAINNAAVNQFFSTTANALGLPTGMAAANVVGQGVGGVLGSAAYALGMWLTGNMSDGDAARCFAAGTAGSVGGAAAGVGVVVLATAYGTAGTGVAISSLSGAAANSAALAWLGGGTAAAGGGGTAVGVAVIGGVVVVAAVVVGSVIYLGYAEYDDAVTNLRYKLTSGYLLSANSQLRELCRRRWFPQLATLH